MKDKVDGKPKILFMLSTCHAALMKNTGKIDCSSGVGVTKPWMTMEYNRHMGLCEPTAPLIESIT